MSDENPEAGISFGIADRIDKIIPEQIRGLLARQPLIPAIAARAKEIETQESTFVRSDQGQIVDILREKEIYYGPSAGLPEMREAITGFWNSYYRLAVPLDSENICMTTGATEGLSLVLTLLSYEEKIGLLPLHWSNYRGIISLCHGEPAVIDLFDRNGSLELNRAREQILRYGIKTLLVNFPTNPTGESLYRHEYERFAHFVRDLDLLVVSDEVYGALRYDGQRLSMLHFLPDRTIVIGGASKEFLIPGARVGYVICYDRKVVNDWLPLLVRASTSNPNVLGQKAFLKLLEPVLNDLKSGKDPKLLTDIKNDLQARMDTLIETIEKLGLSVVSRNGERPVGGISLLARLPSDIRMSDEDFVDQALNRKKFSTVPGSAFGIPGTIRIGYGGMTIENIHQFGRNLEQLLEIIRSERA